MKGRTTVDKLERDVKGITNSGEKYVEVCGQISLELIHLEDSFVLLLLLKSRPMNFHLLQGVQDQNFRIQMLISLSIFDLGEKFQVLRRFEKYTFFF